MVISPPLRCACDRDGMATSSPAPPPRAVGVSGLGRVGRGGTVALVPSRHETVPGPGTSGWGAGMARKFEFSGINHLALVCSDMARTVEFYSGVLGMPLIKTIDLPAGMGQHFFFDCGGGDSLAFFWFPDAPPAQPGVSAPAARPDRGSLTSAISSMNHAAFSVPEDRIELYRDRLRELGIDCTEVANHDDSESGLSEELNDGVFVRSIYFQDPDGILLEFACWTRPLRASDVRHAPQRAIDAAPI